MSGRLAILFLSIFLLWSSALYLRHHTNVSKAEQFTTTPTTHSILAPTENWLGPKLKHNECLLTDVGVRATLNVFYKVIYNAPSFTHRSHKFYLLFRVLRN
jgi:hypothetical protein